MSDIKERQEERQRRISHVSQVVEGKISWKIKGRGQKYESYVGFTMPFLVLEDILCAIIEWESRWQLTLEELKTYQAALKVFGIEQTANPIAYFKTEYNTEEEL